MKNNWYDPLEYKQGSILRIHKGRQFAGARKDGKALDAGVEVKGQRSSGMETAFGSKARRVQGRMRSEG